MKTKTVSAREALLSRDLFEARVLERMPILGEGCWLWPGAVRGGGMRREKNCYGVIQVRPWGLFYVHRLVYHFMVAPLQEGEVVDHGCPCRRGICVHPAFLWATTLESNSRWAAALTNGGRV